MTTDAPGLLLVGSALATRIKVRECAAAQGEVWGSVRAVTDVAQALPLLDQNEFDAILFALAPFAASRLDGIAALDLAAPETPILAIAEHHDLMTARLALRAGAEDCLSRDGLSGPILHRAVTLARERKRKLADLTTRAWRDPLTGLPNRALLEDRLANAAARARRYDALFGVLFIDLDGFKQVNDTIGHAGGDMLLRDVARRLRGALRKGDTVARLGGDEFVVVLENLKRREDAEEVAETIRELLREPFQADEIPVAVSASIGIALYGDEADEPAALLARADGAMYEVKRAKTAPF